MCVRSREDPKIVPPKTLSLTLMNREKHSSYDVLLVIPLYNFNLFHIYYIIKDTIITDSLAERSKAVALGAIPKGRGFEPHSCHFRTNRNNF
jgi:hypothetical protein